MLRLGSALIIVAAALIVPRAAQAQCGNITYTGCCIDDTHSQYCSGGTTLKTKTCSGGTPSCGWVANKSFYSCTTSTDSDPSGTYPRSCDAITDAGAPLPVPDAAPAADAAPTADAAPATDGGTPVPCGSVTATGCCADDTHSKYCFNGELRTKTCGASTPSCGWVASQSFYGCTTTTDSDPSNTYARSCDAVSDGGIVPPADAAPTADAAPAADSAPAQPCGSITQTGCCVDDTHSQYCYNGALKSKTCSGNTPSCGWVAGQSFYGCTTTTDSDPSNTYPRACNAAADGGIVPPADAALASDRGVVAGDSGGPQPAADSGTAARDGGVKHLDAATGRPKEDSSGCGCSVDGRAPLPWLLAYAALALALAWPARRRRRRARRR